MLHIEGLQVFIEDKPILKGLDLAIQPGEVHAIMGPNGSGKSTLAQVLAGQSAYQVRAGRALLNDADLLNMSVDERARAGLFMAFQYPVAIPGVSNVHFLKESYNHIRQARGEPEIDAIDFLALVRSHLQILEMDEGFLYRPLNEGFSGGEKKRNEILQMLLLQPQWIILDEIDSGVDIDALKIIGQAIESMRDGQRSVVMVTHYPRLLHQVRPDRVHVLVDGRIERQGGIELAHALEQSGYQHEASS